MSRLRDVATLATVAAVATVLGTASSFGAPSGANAADLSTFLAEVEEAGQATAPARADLRIHVKAQGAGERRYDGVVAYAGTNVYVEIGEPVVRARMRGAETDALAGATAGGEWKRGTAYDALGDTTLIPDDFRPFRAATLTTPQIVSEAKQTILVSGAPAEPSPWVLIVHLLDRDKLRPVRTQYYERTINNMVRMRRDEELVRVGTIWRPRRIAIEDYRTGASTTVELVWQPSPTLPAGLFDGGAGTVPALRKQP